MIKKTLFALFAVFVIAAGLMLVRLRQPEPPIPAVPTRLNSFRLILDTSASMRGFLSGQTRFKENVPRLISIVDKLQKRKEGLEIKKVEFLTTSESGEGSQLQVGLQTLASTPNQIITAITDDSLAEGQSSMLNLVLESILSTHQEPSVSVLISDMIMSYPNSRIAANPEINRDNIGGLQSYLQNVFNSASAKRLGCCLLASGSQFHGLYYTYRNQPVSPCCASSRPYYILMLGKPEVLSLLLTALKNENFDHDAEAFFGLTMTPGFDVLHYTGRTGKWQWKQQTIVDAVPPVQFTVGLSLQHLASWQTDISNLRRMIHVTPGPGVVIDGKRVRIEPRSKVEISRRDQAGTEQFSHFVTIPVTDLTTASGEVAISLASELPPWVAVWSTLDDTDIESQPNRTFGLEQMVRGVSEAYRKGAAPEFEIKIPIRR